MLTGNIRKKIPFIFIFTLFVVGYAVIISTALTSPSPEDYKKKKLFCDEQEEYAIELIKIHESFVDELARGKLLIRQSFFLVMTGLLFYYLIEKKGKKTPLLERDLLFILLLFATIICHFNEGIMNYWQAEHLNKICILEGALDSTEFRGWFKDSHVYLYKNLPHSENQNLEGAISSYLLFTFSVHLNASSTAFYYLTLFMALFVAFMNKSENESEEQPAPSDHVITVDPGFLNHDYLITVDPGFLNPDYVFTVDPGFLNFHSYGDS